MENRKLRSLFLQKIWSFQARNLELVYAVSIYFSISLCLNQTLIFSIHLFFRYFSIVRNRFFSIHLFPEPSKVSKDHPPVARFILRVSVAGSSRKFIVSPGNYAPTLFWFIRYLFIHNMTFYLYRCDKTAKFVYGDFFHIDGFQNCEFLTLHFHTHTFNGIVIFYWNDLSDLQSCI